MQFPKSQTLTRTFGALGNHNYRWYWLGRLASSATYQMGNVVRGWLVYDLTGSGFALGWVSATGSLANLVLSLYGGVVSDRVPKRTLLMITRSLMVLNTLALAWVVAADHVQVWHLVINSLVSGALFAFMMPAQQAILVELVDRKTLFNAISLNTVAMALMGIVAASAAGFMIERLGPSSVYWFIGALYVWALFTLTRLPDLAPIPAEHGSVLADLRDGLAYIWARRTIIGLLAIALVRVLFAMPYSTLMPMYAENVMQVDARGLGILLSAPGVGALASSLFMAGAVQVRRKRALLYAAGILMGAALIGFVSTAQWTFALVCLVLVGVGSNLCVITNQALLQTACDDSHRGRVMSLYIMMWSLTPLGTIPAGATADAIGVRAVIAIEGALLAALFAAFGFISYRQKRAHRRRAVP